jgi:hypothetical protein
MVPALKEFPISLASEKIMQGCSDTHANQVAMQVINGMVG